MPHSLEVQLLRALGVDTERLVKAVITFEVRQAPKVTVTRLLVLDASVVEQVEQLRLMVEPMPSVSAPAPAPSISTHREL